MSNRKKIKVIYRKLGREKVYGLSEDYTIEIDERIKGKKHFEIILHESLHCLFPKESELNIVKKSILLTNTLWHDGYRKTDNTNKLPLQDGTK